MIRKRRRLAALVLVSLIAVLGAACGSNKPTGTGTGNGSADSGSSAGTAHSRGTRGNTQAPNREALRFARCVRAHGVPDFPYPVNGQPLIDTNRIPSSNQPGGMTILNAATHKCGSVVGPTAGTAGGQGG